MVKTKFSSERRLRNQRGQALIAITALLGITLLVTIYGMTRPVNQSAIDNQKTARALGQAKAALIGYAVSNSIRPGELPCPDINNDGKSDPCSGNTLGRLPWQTLGLPDLRDGSSERLWYALSDTFNGTITPINSDTVGTLTVSGTPGIVAAIFAPGAIVQRSDNIVQNRDCIGCNLNGTCPSPSTPACEPVNYLDLLNGIDNAAGNTTKSYIANPANPTDKFNDRLVVITYHDLMPVVEKRVGRDIRQTLQDYYSANHYLPYAAAIGYQGAQGQGCVKEALTGFIPLSIGNCTGFIQINNLPSWFSDWQNFVYYAIAQSCAPGTTGCSGPGTLLTVGSTTGVQALVITVGTGLSATACAADPNPYGPQSRPSSNICDYLDSVQNTSGVDVYTAADTTSTSTFNDQTVVVLP